MSLHNTPASLSDVLQLDAIRWITGKGDLHGRHSDAGAYHWLNATIGCVPDASAAASNSCAGTGINEQRVGLPPTDPHRHPSTASTGRYPVSVIYLGMH